MLKQKNITLAATLVLGMSLFSSTALATSENTSETAERFYSQELGAEISAYSNTEGGLVPLTKEEFESLNFESESDDIDIVNVPLSKSVMPTNLTTGTVSGDVTVMDVYRQWYKYFESSVTTYTGDPIQVTSDINCNTSTCAISKSVSATVSASYSVSAQAEKDAIKAGVSYTWINSASDTSTYSFSLKKGDKGYVAFLPTKKKSSGSLKKYSNEHGLISSKSVYARTPVKLSNGELKGTYTFIYK